MRDILGITGKGESAMQTVKMINFILMCLFFACYMYQFLYIPVSWLPRKRRAREAPLQCRLGSCGYGLWMESSKQLSQKGQANFCFYWNTAQRKPTSL